jgi:hypothetical protein
MAIDPELFMHQTVDKPMETDRTLAPEGDFDFVIGDFDTKAYETYEFTYERGPNAGLPGSITNFNCPCVTTDPKVCKALDREEVTVFRRMVLEFEEDGMTLKVGKNVNIEIGQLRHAVGQNSDANWSIAKLCGAGPFKGRIEHISGKRKDGSPFKNAQVGRVAPIR